jgi:hypothetical protein
LIANETLDFGERKPEPLEFHDPPNAKEGIRREESVATLRSLVRANQPELFVEVNGTNRLARRLGELTDLQELVLGNARVRARRLRRRSSNGQVANAGGHWKAVRC